MRVKSLGGVLGLVAVIGLLAYLTDGIFLSSRNLTNLTRQVALNGILAVGMTYVILIGGIDLSVGSVVALAGVLAGILQVHGQLSQWMDGSAFLGTMITVIAAIAVGMLCGLFNAWMITRHRIAPFIITLGMMVIARGLALILAKGAAISPLGDHFNFIGQGYLPLGTSLGVLAGIGLITALLFFRIKSKSRSDFFRFISIIMLILLGLWTFQGYRGIPIPVLIFGILCFLGMIILDKTRLGRFVLAIGGNAEAAWLSGIPIQNIVFGIYLCMGAFSGLAGAILAARLNGALPTAGELFELDAIAAVVIGGTSLRGGIGTIRGSIFGAFLIGVLNNGMSLLDVTEFYQKVVKGIIIVVAVWLDMKHTEINTPLAQTKTVPQLNQG